MTRGMVRWLMFHGARKSNLVMPIGEAHRDNLLEHSCQQDQTRMIYMGVEQSFAGVALSAEEARRDSETLQLVYVGSVHQDRGRDVMLEAIKMVNQDKKIAHLTIVGANSEQLEYCQSALRALDVVESVTVLGRVPGHSIPNFMKAADAGLCLWEDLPWYRFNPPTKLFEYLVAGLPVLASDIRTHTQYVHDGKNGLIFEYGSRGLADAIRRLWLARDGLPQMKRQTRDESVAYLWQSLEKDFLEAVGKVAR
ncbi:MAG: glycosyltransferase [Methylotenera sp.]|nr:glycosyltransferase [Methylotenera sp.]